MYLSIEGRHEDKSANNDGEGRAIVKSSCRWVPSKPDPQASHLGGRVRSVMPGRSALPAVPARQVGQLHPASSRQTGPGSGPH